MTPESQRIAIAEVCGWEIRREGVRDHWNVSPEGKWLAAYQRETNGLPNYPNDLNAMHAAEKVLTPQQGVEYAKLLHKTARSLMPYYSHPQYNEDNQLARDFGVLHSTADPRAEAFLRTLGLWK